MQKLHLMLTTASLLVLTLTACDGANAKKATNYLAASDQPGSTPAHLDDILLKREVAMALQRDPLFGNGDVTVYSQQGQITLEGRVDTPAAIAKAADITRKVQGVTFVTNKLEVKVIDDKG